MLTSAARQRLAERYELPLPGNQRRLDASRPACGVADEASMSLIKLATTSMINHAAVTPTIVVPQTMAQLEFHLAAADIDRFDDLLHRIDEIVPPGTNISSAYGGRVNRR